MSEDGNVTTSILHFTPTREDNGKILSCRARNELLKDGEKINSMKLNVCCKYIRNMTLTNIL